MALMARCYHGPFGKAPRHLPFRRAAMSFMRWQLRRGVLQPSSSDRPGSPWWRAVNERILRDGCEAVALSGGLPGPASSRTAGYWASFARYPVARAWYRAHNGSVVAAYLEHRDLAEAENEAERFFMNVVLCRVLFAHALIAAPRMSLGWLGPLAPLLGDPRLGMTGIFLQLSRVLPGEYPLSGSARSYLGAELGFGRLMDFGVIAPRLPQLYEWSSRELAEPGLLELIQDGAMTYAWPEQDRDVWQPPGSFMIQMTHRALPARRGGRRQALCDRRLGGQGHRQLGLQVGTQDARHVEPAVAEQPLDLQAVHERDELTRGRGGLDARLQHPGGGGLLVGQLDSAYRSLISLHEVRVRGVPGGGRLGRQHGEQLDDARPGGVQRREAGQAAQHGQAGPAAQQLRVDLVAVLQHGQQQRLLRREVMQQAGVGQAAPGRDLPQRRTPVAGLAEQGHGLVKDLPPLRAALGVAARGLRGDVTALPLHEIKTYHLVGIDGMVREQRRYQRPGAFMTHHSGEATSTTRTSPVTAELRRARVATGVVFAVHGAVAGTFAARIPWVAQHVGVGVGGLSIALLMPGTGAMLAMPLSGRLVHRHDLRSLVRVLIAVFCAALLLPALPTSLVLLCAALVVYGAAAGLADVSMNAHAVLVEQRYGRSVMSGMHGCWSAGGLIGSAAAAVALRVTPDARAHFLVAAAALAAVAVAAGAWLLPHRPEPEVDAPPAFALPSRGVLLIGLVGLCAVFAEGAGLDWSAVYVHNVLGHPASTAALTVATFSVSMAVARFAGDWVIRRAGPVATVRMAGLCATAGALAVVLTRNVVLVVGGFALIGIGIAVVVPLVFAAAGRIGPHPGRSIAGVAGIAYGSGLIAPGIIGGIARLSSLTVSFVVVVLLTAAMAASAGVLRPAADA
jgi:predicted MFS family arabinose efflux permease